MIEASLSRRVAISCGILAPTNRQFEANDWNTTVVQCIPPSFVMEFKAYSIRLPRIQAKGCMIKTQLLGVRATLVTPATRCHRIAVKASQSEWAYPWKDLENNPHTSRRQCWRCPPNGALNSAYWSYRSYWSMGQESVRAVNIFIPHDMWKESQLQRTTKWINKNVRLCKSRQKNKAEPNLFTLILGSGQQFSSQNFPVTIEHIMFMLEWSD